MNDCVFCYCDICNKQCVSMSTCKNYISVNRDAGRDIEIKHEKALILAVSKIIDE